MQVKNIFYSYQFTFHHSGDSVHKFYKADIFKRLQTSCDFH